MEPDKKKAESYKLYLSTFITLSVMTLLAVGFTHVRMATSLVVGIILLIAVAQATIVLRYNMHLKFHDKILTVFVGLACSLIVFLILITMLDFVNR
ncbi:MAG TPA: cytochrome C oxidase subunit IV family protein [Bacteroidales bacterium]